MYEAVSWFVSGAVVEACDDAGVEAGDYVVAVFDIGACRFPEGAIAREPAYGFEGTVHPQGTIFFSCATLET